MLLTKKQAISILCRLNIFLSVFFFLHLVSENDKMFGPVSLEILIYEFHFTHEKEAVVKATILVKFSVCQNQFTIFCPHSVCNITVDFN